MDNTKDTPIDYKQFEGHTPAPWRVDDSPGCRKIKGGKTGSQKQSQYQEIGWTTGLSNDDRDRANAYLFAAAPDLLKENQSLKLELQKQKELNAELVAAADILYSELVYESVNGSKRLWGRNGGESAPDRITKLESLIKKSSEI